MIGRRSLFPELFNCSRSDPVYDPLDNQRNALYFKIEYYLLIVIVDSVIIILNENIQPAGIGFS